MDIRRLVKSGAASHTLALPIAWIQKNRLKKGDLLSITEQDNRLVISTSTEQPAEQKAVTIELEKKDIGTVRRETIAAYLNNATIVTFTGDITALLPEIKKILDNFLALEIIEQTPRRLVAKDFLNLKEFSPPVVVRRMDMLVRSMLDDVTQKQAAALELTDYGVDKLYFLISRLFRATLAQGGSGSLELFSQWWLAKNLENIADAAKNLAPHMTKETAEHLASARAYYLDCAAAYFKGDKRAADQLMAARADLISEFDAVASNGRELLKQMVNTSRNIAKSVVDN